MDKKYRNIYKISRETAGITQERAAELLDISVDSLRVYESGRRIPTNDIVVDMTDVYGTRHLAYQHLRATVCGRKCLPNLELVGLPEATLKFLREWNEFCKAKNLMIEIAADGKIDPQETIDWDNIVAELDELLKAIVALKYHQDPSEAR